MAKKHDLPEGFAAQTMVRLLQQGKRDRLYMRMDDARSRFREALEMSPDHPEALMELGRTYDPIEGPSEEETGNPSTSRQSGPGFHRSRARAYRYVGE